MYLDLDGLIRLFQLDLDMRYCGLVGCYFYIFLKGVPIPLIG